jgi:hypothetical protein
MLPKPDANVHGSVGVVLLSIQQNSGNVCFADSKPASVAGNLSQAYQPFINGLA